MDMRSETLHGTDWILDCFIPLEGFSYPIRTVRLGRQGAYQRRMCVRRRRVAHDRSLGRSGLLPAARGREGGRRGEHRCRRVQTRRACRVPRKQRRCGCSVTRHSPRRGRHGSQGAGGSSVRVHVWSTRLAMERGTARPFRVAHWRFAQCRANSAEARGRGWNLVEGHRRTRPRVNVRPTVRRSRGSLRHVEGHFFLSMLQ